MRPFFALALTTTACTSHTEMRGDWCGTTRAEIHHAGELAEKCDDGDFLACERAETECKRGAAFFCRDHAPAKTATPVELRARFASACDAGKADACVDEAELAVRAGEDPEQLYRRACDRGDSTACFELGSRLSARASVAKDARDWNKAVRPYRLACFKQNVSEACTALEAFRASARSEAGECEAGRAVGGSGEAGTPQWQSVCERAAAMLRAVSQGPADEARADALSRKISR